MTPSCCAIVDRKGHVQYLQFQRAISDDCTWSLTEQNIAINDHNDANDPIYRALLVNTNIKNTIFLKKRLDFVKKVFCCMNNLYISHRSLYAPTYSFWAIRSMLISLYRVASRFDTVCNIVTRWVNFTQKKTIAWTWTTIIWLQYLEVFLPKYYVFLIEKYIFTIFANELFRIKLKYYK